MHSPMTIALASEDMQAATMRSAVAAHGDTGLQALRQPHRHEASAGLHYAVFERPEGTSLFATELLDLWWRARTAAGGREPLLLYLTCGSHPDPRTPLLQHLLHFLDHRGPVHALRVPSAAALADALCFAAALAGPADPVVILHDQTAMQPNGGLARYPSRFRRAALHS